MATLDPTQFTTTILHHAADPFRLLVESVKEYAIYLLDPAGQIVSWNTGAERTKGYPAEEALGQPFDKMFTSADAERGEPLRILEAALADGRHEEEGHRPRKDGSLFWAVQTVTALHQSGRHVGYSVIIRDISERKQAEEALRASEERFRLLIEGVKDYAIYMLTVDGTVETWNESAVHIYGYSAEEIIGQHRRLFFTPEDVAGGAPQHELDLAAARGHASEEGWRVRKDGSLFWANGTMSVLHDAAGGLRGFVKVVRDLSERRSAENELRLSESRFRSLITAIAKIVWTTDATGENHIATPTWAEYTGLPEEEVRGWGWLTAIHPSDRSKAAERWRHSLETSERVEVDFRIRRADGQWRHFSVRGVPLLNEAGAVWEWVGVCEDDTEQRQAEETLRLRNRAIQAVSQGIVITDPNQADNPIIYVSHGFEVITGYTNEVVLGRSCRFLQGPDTDSASVRTMRDAIRTGRECSVELLNYKKDGTPFWNALSLTPVHDDDRNLVHFVGVLADVTEQRELQQALQQSQKMDAIGRLAGGVAHDFNNLLTVISGYSDMLLMEMPTSNPHRGMVVEIREAGERAAALTRQLLAFSRKQVIAPVVLDLNEVLVQSESMLRRLIGEDIDFAIIRDPNLPRVKADSGQVDQVVMNLCANARDAMPTGGRLTIETKAFVLEEGHPAYSDLAPGRFAQLSVTDTGLGMTEKVKAQIFEPFFTTKEPGKGTGLGLATVFGIVEQSHAHISVSSEVGVGTAFKILFLAEDSPLAPALDSSLNRPLRGTETILLVEDEAGVRKIARISLEAQGYEVLEAVGGTDAIQKSARHAGTIHLVVTDVVMPEMGGRQLADALRTHDPGIKVLFMSGYTDDAVIRHGIIEQTDNFLQKPFTPLGFAKKVRAVLDEAK